MSTIIASDVVLLARDLLRENYNSYNYAYDEADEGDDLIIAGLSVTDSRMGKLLKDNSLFQVHKCMDYYAYQSCEHPSWEASLSKEMCDSLKIKLSELLKTDVISTLDYLTSEWGI